MVTGDGYRKPLGSLGFLVFLLISSFGGWLREMVTGDGYGKWLREVSGKSRFSCFSLNFFFWGDGYGRWLREMVTGSLWEVSVFLFFS